MKALLRRSVVACLVAGAAACAPGELPENPERMAELKKTYDALHKRLEKAASEDPTVQSAFSEKGQVVIAIRSGLIEELAGNVSQRYLDEVKVDLHDVKGHSSGEINKDTFLGRMKAGDWDVRVVLGSLVGKVSAGAPRVGLRKPDLIDITLPVDVHPSEGTAHITFKWDSASVANLLCKDFEISREIRGRVLRQQHVLIGALRLDNTGESLSATPVFPNRKVQLKVDLTPKSWETVEEALRSQNTFGKCGTFLKPAAVLERLRDLGQRGIGVTLPDSIFRVINLPGHLQEAVKVNGQRVGLDVKAESLRVDTATLWSSASVQVKAPVKAPVKR